ncbi:unnamed protein product [Rhizophagus irregularis]|nr:unnamed protein product [Rhizophagus irregularis]
MNVNERRVKTRTKEKCYCNKCNGKYVDPRTKQKHSMSLSLDDATTSNDPMSIGSSFVNEEISIDPQESISSSENLSTFSSKRRKRSRYNTYLERDTQMQNINNSDDNNDSNEETDNYGDSDDGDDSDDNDDGDDSDDNDDGDDGDDNDDGMMGMITMMGMMGMMGMIMAKKPTFLKITLHRIMIFQTILMKICKILKIG